jgi:antitoxin (DNA-binding transcriptional repressor) of toxin-antitoxin stability system
MRVGVSEAKRRLSDLLKAVENGEPVTICRNGVPVADLVRSTANSRRKPLLGTMRDQVQIHDPDWWKPLPAKDLVAVVD